MQCAAGRDRDRDRGDRDKDRDRCVRACAACAEAVLRVLSHHRPGACRARTKLILRFLAHARVLAGAMCTLGPAPHRLDAAPPAVCRPRAWPRALRVLTSVDL